jgi:hypothetical protein
VVFRPVLLLPDDATRERVLSRFASAARAAPLCLTGAELRKGGGCIAGVHKSFARHGASTNEHRPLTHWTARQVLVQAFNAHPNVEDAP